MLRGFSGSARVSKERLLAVDRLLFEPKISQGQVSIQGTTNGKENKGVWETFTIDPKEVKRFRICSSIQVEQNEEWQKAEFFHPEASIFFLKDNAVVYRHFLEAESSNSPIRHELGTVPPLDYDEAKFSIKLNPGETNRWEGTVQKSDLEAIDTINFYADKLGDSSCDGTVALGAQIGPNKAWHKDLTASTK